MNKRDLGRILRSTVKIGASQSISPTMAQTPDTKQNLKLSFEKMMKKEMKELRQWIPDEMKKLTEKLDKIESDFNQRFTDDSLAVADLTLRVQQLEAKTSEPPSNNALLAQRLDELEREKYSTTAIIRGIPNKENEDLHELFSDLCHSVKCTPIINTSTPQLS